MRVAGGLRRLQLGLDAIFTSPLARAAQTAEIVADEFGGVPAARPMPELASGATPAEIVAALERMAPHQAVLAVGHEPTLSRLASLLLTGSSEAAPIRLKQGGVIALEFEERIERGAGRLRWMMTQRQLRKLGK